MGDINALTHPTADSYLSNKNIIENVYALSKFHCNWLKNEYLRSFFMNKAGVERA